MWLIEKVLDLVTNLSLNISFQENKNSYYNLDFLRKLKVRVIIHIL